MYIRSRGETLSRSDIAFSAASRARITGLSAAPLVLRGIVAGSARRRLGRGHAAAFARIADQLERRAIVAGRTHRNAPVGHGHVGVERRRLQKRSLRFEEPERVHLRDALIEELPRLLGRGGHRHVVVPIPS